jgi:multiple sugar transport system substrate-binding protein
VADITSYVDSTKDLYTPSSWSAVDFGGKIYGVPQDSGPAALLYRKDIFAQYGIEVPKTWDDYIAAAQKLHQAAPDVYIGQFSPNEVAGLYYTDVVQEGGSWYGTKGDSWTVEVNNKASQKVAARYQTLLDQKLVKVEQMWTPEYWADVNSGKIASINDAAWFPAVLESNAGGLAGKWAVAPSPSDKGDGTSGDTGGAVLAVTKTAKDPAAAAKFITWLNSSEDGVNHLITEGGIYPAAKAGLDSPALNEPSDYFGGQNINEVFKAAAAKVPTSNVEGPGFNATVSSFTDEFAKVATGAETFSAALDNVQAATVKRLKGEGLSVK